MKLRNPRAFGATALLVALAAACGSSSHSSSTPITVFNVSADPSRSLPVIDTKHHVALTSAALRSTLDSLLAKHATLVAALVDEIVDDSTTPTPAITALTANTADLTGAIEQVYGANAARAFAQLWAQHTQFFIDYANAAHGHDGSAKEAAESKLGDYQNDFASFVSTATAGGASLNVVAGLLHSHLHDITSYIDAAVSGDRFTARRILAAAVAHMHVIANAVTRAILAQHLKTVSG
jgi:hypothetical protein